MVISHKYKFIFIKTRKTAGTSLEVFLSQCCAEKDILTPINPRVEPHHPRNFEGFWNPLPEMMESRDRGLLATIKKMRKRGKFYNHIPARNIKNRISKKSWNGYFKFCIERNPWDKTLSHYHMASDRAQGNLTLDQYLDAGKFCLNYPLYTDANGHLMVDRVIRYESLIEELDQVFGMLGIAFNGTLGVRAKSDHRADRRPYQHIFTSKQKAIIEKIFSNEIEMHGYTY